MRIELSLLSLPIYYTLTCYWNAPIHSTIYSCIIKLKNIKQTPIYCLFCLVDRFPELYFKVNNYYQLIIKTRAFISNLTFSVMNKSCTSKFSIRQLIRNCLSPLNPAKRRYLTRQHAGPKGLDHQIRARSWIENLDYCIRLNIIGTS